MLSRQGKNRFSPRKKAKEKPTRAKLFENQTYLEKERPSFIE
jgi:hypothetical protein